MLCKRNYTGRIIWNLPYAGELRNHGSEADGRKRSRGYHLPDGRSAGKNEKTGWRAVWPGFCLW